MPTAQGDNSLRLRRPAFSHWPHLFRGLEFHRHSIRLHLQRRGQLLTNWQPEILELRLFENHSRIDVYDLKPRSSGEIPGMPQKHEAVGTLPARIGIGEMHAYIA